MQMRLLKNNKASSKNFNHTYFLIIFLTLNLLITSAFAQNYLKKNSGNSFETKRFDWNYKNREYSIIGDLSRAIYNQYKKRSRFRNYDLFASDKFDDILIQQLAESLQDLGKKSGFNEFEIAYLAVSFVQALPYTSDDVTTGFDEYPRFPYETLFDGGGDCEDTSILAVALLKELGFGAVLIAFDDHMGVGVACDKSITGYHYKDRGIRYCYLETTGKNWSPGLLPSKYQRKTAQIIHVYKKPALDINFKTQYEYNTITLLASVDVVINNLGSETAKNIKVYVSLQTEDITKVWDRIESDVFNLEPEGTYSFGVNNLKAPSGAKLRVRVLARADNANPKEVYSKWLSWSK
jgi:hypothetical protein